MAESWETIAARKQAARNALIPGEWRLQSLPGQSTLSVLDIPRRCGILTQSEIDITENYDATALAQAIRGRVLTCEDVTRAFCKRAAIAQQLTNCLTEIFFDRALARAKYLDDYISYHGTPIGPLHGVPISLKDSFRIPGLDSSIGMAVFCFKASNSASPLVSILLSAGAVIYCKTNVPQTLMTFDSVNNIWGRTLNPLNRRITAGGSSGGEGALIAMRGSILGVGTDIGGSIRVPAACHGLYGIKPSANRIPYANQESGGMPGVGKLGIEPSAGPIASSLRDCRLFLETIAAAEPWRYDPCVIPGLWPLMDSSDCSVASIRSKSSATRPLTIGILASDGITTPLPPISRLLEDVTHGLRASGHHVRLLDNPPSTLRKAQSLANAFFEIEGSNTMLDHLEAHDEPLIPWLGSRLKRKPQATLARVASLQGQRELLMTETLALWRLPSGEELDAIVCPVAPHPIPEIDRFNASGYTSMWTLLDYPAGTVPVRMFNENDLEGEVSSKPAMGSWDAKNRELWDKATVDRTVYLGTPLSVQVVAPRLQERRLYRAMEAVDIACKEHVVGGGNRPSSRRTTAVNVGISSKSKL